MYCPWDARAQICRRARSRRSALCTPRLRAALTATACARVADAYRKKIDLETTRINRIRSLQQRAVALVGTAIVAAFVSTGNVLGQLYYNLILTNGELAAVVLGVAIVSVLLACLLTGTCIRRMMRK